VTSSHAKGSWLRVGRRSRLRIVAVCGIIVVEGGQGINNI
jgi:hypothetical protein